MNIGRLGENRRNMEREERRRKKMRRV